MPTIVTQTTVALTATHKWADSRILAHNVPEGSSPSIPDGWEWIGARTLNDEDGNRWVCLLLAEGPGGFRWEAVRAAAL